MHDGSFGWYHSGAQFFRLVFGFWSFRVRDFPNAFTGCQLKAFRTVVSRRVSFFAWAALGAFMSSRMAHLRPIAVTGLSHKLVILRQALAKPFQLP